MNDRTKAALIGGVVAGVLSGLPVVGGCCFLWAIAGGFLAVFMYLKSVPAQMMAADGAKLGVTTGIIGAVISTLLGLPFMLLGIGSAAMQSADLERAGVSAGILAVGGFVGIILRALFVIGFAVLGGVIGAAVLGKKGPGPGGGMPPPPPTNYGDGGVGTQPPAGGGGGYGGGAGGGGSFGAGS
ncbi:MAG TPA: hypothetical protein VJ842_09225 [Pyrinomonadaceae bacterium]|nr:hypothetical protein [Pyrinomonadaceae bacterium]